MRKSSPKRSKGKRSSSKTTQKRTSKRGKKNEYTCIICRDDGRRKNFVSSTKEDVKKHFKENHKEYGEKGVDLEMFFEVLRVLGLISVGVGIYALGNKGLQTWVEENPDQIKQTQDSMDVARDYYGNTIVE